MIRSMFKRLVRVHRSLIQRLTGLADLRDRLDRQQATLEALHALVLQHREAQQQLLLRVSAPPEAPLSSPRNDATLLERLIAQQTQLRTAITASIKASETAILESLGEEVDRLDGYLVFHANELRAAVGRVEASVGPSERRDDHEPPLSHAA